MLIKRQGCDVPVFFIVFIADKAAIYCVCIVVVLLQYKKDMISAEDDFLNLKILLIRSKILTK